MTEVPYVWVLVLLVVAFAVGAIISALRFVNSGGNPSHAVGILFNGVLAIVMGLVVWLAISGPPLP